MNLVVEHIGKLSKADIKLDGITVIAGQNGSGKSTISRVLMTLCSVLRQLPLRIVDERLKSARELVNAILKSHNLPEIARCLFAKYVDLIKFIVSESWKNSKIIEENILEYSIFREFFKDNSEIQIVAEKIFAIKDEIISAVKNVQKRDITYYLPFIFTDSFETAISKGFATAGSEQDCCSVCLVSDENIESKVSFKGGKYDNCQIDQLGKIPLVFYFEPVHLLDYYDSCMKIHNNFNFMPSKRYNANDTDWNQFLFGDVDKSDWSVERKQKHEEILKTLDELLNVIRGHLEKQGRELRFIDDDVSISVPIMNVASGIKTMSVIEKGIRSGTIQPGCLLIIDEPESNLHPQWQIEFAHFLVKLNVQFNIRLLLNTHSPFFLKAIEVFSREENCGGRTHYYYMDKNKEGVGYNTKELKNGTNEIFKTYFDAMNDLLSR